MARYRLRHTDFLLTLCCIIFCLGCRPSPKTEKTTSPDSENTPASVTITAGVKSEESNAKSGENEDLHNVGKVEKKVSKPSKPQKPSPPLTIPNVGLTDSLRATCLVNVGDVMPGGEVHTTDGKKVSLQSQYGENFTVVFLWAEGKSNYLRITAYAALEDLQSDISEPFAAKGVKVIGINVGDKPPLVQQELQKAGVKLPFYFDPDKSFFSKIAKSILPRVYLLDASGKIVWFDIEYSQSTRRNLAQAVQVSLGEN